MDELLLSTKRTLKTFRYGDVVEGVVVSAGRKGVFVDLGAKSEGVIDTQEIEEEVDSIVDLKVGDSVVASVVQTENDQGYVILSLKRARDERVWRGVASALKEGAVLEVKVSDFNKGGLVVEGGPSSTIPGLHGFIPFSHLDTPFNSTETDSVKNLLGQTLKVRVIELDRSLNRVVFSQKLASLSANPRIKKFFDSLTPQKKMAGMVTSIFPFGIFVELAPGVEGLVHISELGWERVDHPSEVVNVGDKIEAVVLGVNKERGQLALSMKALHDNPWEKFGQQRKVGDAVAGVVTKVVPFGAFVKLPEGIEGLVHVSETTGPLAEGEKVEVVIVNLEPDKQKLGLSVKKLKK